MLFFTKQFFKLIFLSSFSIALFGMEGDMKCLDCLSLPGYWDYLKLKECNGSPNEYNVKELVEVYKSLSKQFNFPLDVVQKILSYCVPVGFFSFLPNVNVEKLKRDHLLNTLSVEGITDVKMQAYPPYSLRNSLQRYQGKTSEEISAIECRLDWMNRITKPSDLALFVTISDESLIVTQPSDTFGRPGIMFYQDEFDFFLNLCENRPVCAIQNCLKKLESSAIAPGERFAYLESRKFKDTFRFLNVIQKEENKDKSITYCFVPKYKESFSLYSTFNSSNYSFLVNNEPKLHNGREYRELTFYNKAEQKCQLTLRFSDLILNCFCGNGQILFVELIKMICDKEKRKYSQENHRIEIHKPDCCSITQFKLPLASNECLNLLYKLIYVDHNYIYIQNTQTKVCFGVPYDKDGVIL